MEYRQLYVVLPETTRSDWHRRDQDAAALLEAYQSLWHPSFIQYAERPPECVHEEDDFSLDGSFVTVLKPHWDQMNDASRARLKSQASELAIRSGPSEPLTSHSIPVPADDLASDFHALGGAYLCMQVLFRCMEQELSVDSWLLLSSAKEAEAAMRSGDFEAARHRLREGFDLLLGARQSLYPATISWVDLAIFHSSCQANQFRPDRHSPLNVIMTASEMKSLSDSQPDVMNTLRQSVANGEIEVLGGLYDAVPMLHLGMESRLNQFDRSSVEYRRLLDRDVESFGSRTLGLTPDLPQLLMKYRYRYGLHDCFDGSRRPHFHDPMIHWTAPDGSVLESVSRSSVHAGAEKNAFAVFDRLAKTLMNDRAATIVLAHWINEGAAWYHLLRRIHSFAPVFGKWERLSDYFLYAGIPDRPVQSRLDEYQTVLSRDALPASITQAVIHFEQQGIRECAATAHVLALFSKPDRAVSTSQDIQNSMPVDDAFDAWAKALTRGGTSENGFLLLNAGSFPQRATVSIPGYISRSPEVHALQHRDGTTTAVVDVASSGYVWLAAAANPPAASSEDPPLLATGKRLRNELVELEIDSKAGGLRGIWRVRSGYSRLGQQLVYGDHSRMICKSLTISENGPAAATIETRGDISAGEKSHVIAHYVQRFRLSFGRPEVELEIELSPIASPGDEPLEHLFACRWAWPDEKATISLSSGLTMLTQRGANWETPGIIEWRERHLLTRVVTRGLPLHRRVAPRMADTFLPVSPGATCKVAMTIALDMTYPFSTLYEHFMPVRVLPVHARPSGEAAGWLVQQSSSTVVRCGMHAVDHDPLRVRFRFVETAGKSRKVELKFLRRPVSARLTNFRDQLIFELRVESDTVSIDFSAYEMLQVEVTFDGPMVSETSSGLISAEQLPASNPYEMPNGVAGEHDTP